MIRVLGLALYGPLAASTRYRLGQYVPGLASRGIDLQIRHLLGDEYLLSRFGTGSLPIGSMLKSGVARFRDLLDRSSYDMAMLHCELFPFMPGVIERALIRRPYIYDFDDAFYLKYRSGRFAMVSPVLGSKFDNVIAGATAVTAGNHTLACYAKRYNRAVQYLPTVVDIGRYSPTSVHSNKTFTVGWIGSPSTAPYLSELIEPLQAIGKEGPVRFIVIGGTAPAIPNVEVVEVPWQERTEVDLINTFDVGVMPLPDDGWARGKCAFKLIQYMACGVPVGASRVGANVDAVGSAAGFMASTVQEWTEGFRALRDSVVLRTTMAAAGRERVVEHYSLQRNLPIIESVIRQVIKG